MPPKFHALILFTFSALPALADDAPHVAQSQINTLLERGQTQAAFDLTFEVGDEIFEHTYTAAQGGGANVGNGQRFTLVPRADLNGTGAWASHVPPRFTGPNAQSCAVCHGQPFGDGSGPVSMNNIRDPNLTGQIKDFINRQPPHIFGIGALQLLAEEMTTELCAQRDAAISKAKETRTPVQVSLTAKGVSFGQITAQPNGEIDTNMLDGIDADLVVKPLEWKGLSHFVRGFVRDASHQEIGLQATELVGVGNDGDGDGVVNELSVGDITALTIYQAAQPRPVTKVELSKLGLIDPLSKTELAAIETGALRFDGFGCASCHTPVMYLDNPVYSEPSLHPDFRDAAFPNGTDPSAHGLSPILPVSFDITKDLPDNVIALSDGRTVALGNFTIAADGRTTVALYSDLKRHAMGAELAEAVDEKGVPADIFVTQELWGIGSTAPYLHDGRATTLVEAIAFHGGDAATARANFNAAPQADQSALLAFLDNLVLFKIEEED